jgi:hypothetical protein
LPRVRHPQTQGKVERFHGSLERALDCRGVPAADHQQWLDAFRREHNHIRPHEALGMQTPASRWQPSPRRYNPNPPAWEYPEGAWTLKDRLHGTIDIHEQTYRIAKSLIGERVRIVPAEQRFLVYYCNTLIRELDPATRRSTIVDRYVSKLRRLDRNRRMSFQGIGDLSSGEKMEKRAAGPRQGTRSAGLSPPLTVSMSRSRLFLGGLLSSRARLRFTSRILNEYLHELV